MWTIPPPAKFWHVPKLGAKETRAAIEVRPLEHFPRGAKKPGKERAAILRRWSI